MKNILLIFIALLITASCKYSGKESEKEYRDFLKTETQEEKDERMQWWRDAGFGMFIHWGLYAVPAGQYGEEKNHAEWIQETADIPVDEYEKYAEQFNPVKFNASEWVKLAKNAGMKYIVITSKHHDGFCLWNSKVSDYDIIDRTPYNKDLLKELAEACDEEGITLCFYHSIMDWNHPHAQGINHPDYNYGKGPNPDFRKYSEEYMKPQLKELLSDYGHIGVLWFDGEWIKEWTEEEGKDLYNMLRNIQADLIINNRVGKGRQGMKGMNAYENAAGDFGTPEQEILESTSDMDWESCMTMNDHWGYNKFDNNFKSTGVLIHNLLDIAAKGGNYLLNVGPTAEGLIPDESIERLNEIGEWMSVNSEVIHNSRGCKNYKEGEAVYYVQSNNGEYLYAVMIQWPGESIRLKYAEPEADSEITLLGYDKPLTWKDIGKEGIELQLPEEWQDEDTRQVKYAWAIKMKGKQADVADKPEFYIQDKLIENKFLFTDEIEVELKSLTPDARIFYTLNGTKPNEKSLEYNAPIRINESTDLKSIAMRTGFVNSPVSEFSLLKSGNFESIEFEYPFSQKYAALGNLSLGDGVFGSEEDYHNNWLGFEGVDMITTIDLGTEKMIHKVMVNFMNKVKSWIFLPEYLEIEISGKGKEFKLAGTAVNKIAPADKKVRSFLFSVEFPKVKTRFVRIKARNIEVCPEWHQGAGGKAWIFTDEIIIE